MVISLYRAATVLAGPAVPLLLRRRQARGKEDPARRGERLGQASQPRPDGPVIWLHAASVGESLAALPVIDRLLDADPARHVVVTTHTLTSAGLMGERLPFRAIHQVSPLDRPSYVTRFLDHWRPDAAIWMESELWPNMLCALGEREIPAALLNARMSARTAARWRRFNGTWQRMMTAFSLVQPSSARAAEMLTSLGTPRLAPAGNLKYAGAAPPVDTDALAALRRAIDGRPTWIAASTHAGEEAAILAAHRQVREGTADALLILMPRHPNRGDDVAGLIADPAPGPGQGTAPPRRSDGDLPSRDQPTYLADTLGEMGTLLSAADVAFIGGSLVPVGGHNPLEPARLKRPILSGHAVDNFADIYQSLAQAGGARLVGAGELAPAIVDLLSNPSQAAAMVAAADTVVDRQASLLDEVMAVLSPLLPPIAAPPTRSAS